ncbi:MAG: ATP synthase F1 subunit gamma [Candidatus Melainabacteria bacterium]|jgi:F-type H+-transporting ATPase subunit gamma|uniref:ATP synthase gamma chain n=1 Tax=Candidatus Obscuribacter phosphatis TaxID=1906157 RepID=A0A8J7TKQ9_9BACT|nr:ATP synthase F1 subunit gamma [Candidatus Obscuribacter phosphatis]MCA0312572.1 ATP synthase F1 subunit gamma [Candidatus Melainabacteria bacterium]OPZ91340.1 MAG: ATP synthase gamma chain [bacterium ADurb.Bin425]
MANLKAIRQRIKSVQSTQKITRAMRLVAAAKVRRAQMRVQGARPFTQAVVRILREVVAEVSPIDLHGIPLLEKRPIKKVAIIVLSSDRGLCGGYNTSVFREVMSRISVLQGEGKEVGLILVGMKANSFFKSIKVEKLKSYTLLPAIPTVEEAKLIAGYAGELYTEGKVDAVEVIGTDFISLLRSEVVNTKYLPVELPAAMEKSTVATPLRLFEPSILTVMEEELLPKYIENVIFQALLEASASELAARMNAMTNASNNARDLISSLTLVYNKARQAAITQELLEIVGGAEALKG